MKLEDKERLDELEELQDMDEELDEDDRTELAVLRSMVREESAWQRH